MYVKQADQVATGLFGESGVYLYSEFVIRRTVYRCFLHYQFPQTILLSNCECVIIVEDMLSRGDDLNGGVFLLIALSLLTEQVCFGTLELLDLLCQ